MSKIGIIAGGGNLPKKIIAHCQTHEIPFFVVGLKGQMEEGCLDNLPHIWAHLGQTGKAIDEMKSQNVEKLVMAGDVRRPSITELRPDMRTLKLFTRLGKKAFGDDALLRGIREELEKDGFDVIGAHEIMPDLLIGQGVLGKIKPKKSEMVDIERGAEVAKTLGALDVGQSVIVQQGIVLGVEGVEGTDVLIKRCADLKRKGGGAILVKMTKPQQDRRLDLPTIGMRTIDNAIEAGLSGIALTAGGGLLLDREEAVRKADNAGIFLMGIDGF